MWGTLAFLCISVFSLRVWVRLTREYIVWGSQECNMWYARVGFLDVSGPTSCSFHTTWTSVRAMNSMMRLSYTCYAHLRDLLSVLKPFRAQANPCKPYCPASLYGFSNRKTQQRHCSCTPRIHVSIVMAMYDHYSQRRLHGCSEHVTATQ